MADLPEPDWTGEKFLDWLRPAFVIPEQSGLPEDGAESGDSGEADQEQPPGPLWADVREGLLRVLEVDERALETARLGVLSEFLRYLDEDLDEEEVWQLLDDPDKRDAAVLSCCAQWDGGLSWVTPEQQRQLDELDVPRGDWHEWLPGQLTQWWPEWLDATADVLAPWLDADLPSLFLPTGDAEEEVAEEAADTTAGGRGV